MAAGSSRTCHLWTQTMSSSSFLRATQRRAHYLPVCRGLLQLELNAAAMQGLKQWVPINVITGGTTANGLVQGMKSDLTKEVSVGTLKREMAKALYKDMDTIKTNVLTKIPMFKARGVRRRPTRQAGEDSNPCACSSRRSLSLGCL